MTVLQMLPEMVRAEELLGLVTFAKFMNMIEMLCSCLPVGGVRELFSAVPAGIECCWSSGRWMESGLGPSKSRTGPRMAPEMK